MLTNQPVAIKFVSTRQSTCTFGIADYLFIQEPRKSDAPQLRDEFRSYRTLNSTRTYAFGCVLIISAHSGFVALFVLSLLYFAAHIFSWRSPSAPFRFGRSPQ